MLNLFRHAGVYIVQPVVAGKNLFPCQKLEIPVVLQSVLDGHVLRACRISSGGVIVKECFRFREDSVVEHAEVAFCRHPVAVRCLLVEHQAIRTVARINEAESLVGDDIRHITFFSHSYTVFQKFRRIIISLFFLSGHDAPIVESFRFGDQMPLTYDSRPVSGLLKQLRKCLLRTVETAGIVSKSVHMT